MYKLTLKFDTVPLLKVWRQDKFLQLPQQVVKSFGG